MTDQDKVENLLYSAGYKPWAYRVWAHGVDVHQDNVEHVRELIKPLQLEGFKVTSNLTLPKKTDHYMSYSSFQMNGIS